MAQGIQAWNSQGTLIVDIGDYNIRYVGSMAVSLAAGTTQWSIGYSGMTATGWIVTIQEASQYWAAYYACRTYEGGFRIAYLPTSNITARTINVDIWRYE